MDALRADGDGAPRRGRIAFFDELRGFTIISMVGFHASYDLAYLFGVSMPWFTAGVFQDAWRASISWTFLAMAGWMTSCSRNNLKRAGVYAAAATLVSIATTVAAVDVPVSYGILFCMAASTLIYALAQRGLDRVNPLIGMATCLAAFLLTLGIPRSTYPIEHLAWLGLPSPTFASGDYYPLIPFSFMYLSGAFGARAFARYAKRGYPAWMKRNPMPWLSWLGKRSLVIYLLHQPLVLLALRFILG